MGLHLLPQGLQSVFFCYQINSIAHLINYMQVMSQKADGEAFGGRIPKKNELSILP